MTDDNRETFTYLTSPSDAGAEEDKHDPGSPAAANPADDTGQSYTLDSSSLETVPGKPATASPSLIIGSAVEGPRLTVSTPVTGAENPEALIDNRRRFYAHGSRRTATELRADTSTTTFAVVTAPPFIAPREEDGIAVSAGGVALSPAFAAATGTRAAATSSVGASGAQAEASPGSDIGSLDIGSLAVIAPGNGGASDASTRPALSRAAASRSSALGAASALTITPTVTVIGSPIKGQTLTASVITGGFIGTIAYQWQRFYSGGWWDIPIELSPYSAGEVFTYVTTPTYVVRAEDANVLAIRVEASYLDTAGQIVTLDSAAAAITEPPRLNAANVTLGENAASVALAITDAVHNSGYTLAPTVTIGGVPAGWSLRGDRAVRVASGTWIAGSNSLSALRLVSPSPDESKSFTLSVKASETAVGPTGAMVTATAIKSFAVHVTDVAELPVFGPTQSWSGNEEGPITLSGLRVSDDPDDAVQARISGVPAGWTVIDPGVTTIVGTSGGAAGTVRAGDLGRLVVSAPDQGGESALLTLTVSTPEGAGTSAVETLTVSASAVAEAPLLRASAAIAVESTGAALTIALALSETAFDGDDRLGAVTLSGVPSGWSLAGDSAASLGPGRWSAGAASLAALHLVAPAGAEATRFTIGVAGSSSEGGLTAAAATSFAVTLSEVAEVPMLRASAALAVESTGAALTLGLALSDTAADGDDTLGAVTLSGVPSGWSLSGDAAASLGGGVWSAGAASLGALTLVSPAGQDGTRFTLGVTAGSSETGAAATAFAATSLAVTVSAVAEAPLLSAAAATTAENGGAALTLGLALSDTAADGDDTLGAVTLSGVPSGWSLSGDAAASLGGGVWSAAAASLAALTLVSPAGQDGTRFTLGVTAGSSEAGAGATAFAATSLAVTVSAVAEAPLLSAAAATTAENGGAALTLGLALSDTAADGDDTLGAVTLSGVPSGWSLSGDAAASLGGGVWSAGAASLAALTLVSPAGQDGTRFTLGVTAGSGEAGAGATAFAATSLAVTVSAVAEAPLLSAAAATTAENGGAALTLGLALSDTAADGDDTLGAVTLSGVPSGWSLSGDAAASLGGGVWSAGAASLGALTLVSPAGQDGTRFTIGVTAGSSEAGAGATAFAATSLAVTVSAVAEAPLLSAAAATTAENGGAALTVALALSDTAADGDDTLGAVTLSGVPSGWSLSGDAAASLGGGVWSAGAASLGALTLVSPAGQDGTRFTIGVTAGSSEAGAGATAFAATSLAVTVSAVAEAPLLSAAAATTAENGGAALTLGLALSDTAADGDDTLGAVTLSGVPSGWSLSGDAAASLGGGVWSAGAASLGALTLVSPAGQDGTRFTLGVTAGSGEAGAAATAFAATSLAVTVSAVAEAPLLSAAAATTAENGGAALTLGLALSDTAADGDDTLGAVTLSGVPSGWSLSGDAAASLGGGVWSAGAASLGALTLVSPAGQDGTRFTLGVTAGSSETGAGATAFAATSLAVTVSAVAEAPLLSAAAATTAENGGAALTVALALSDTAADGDDTLGAVTLSGVPSGWSLSGDAAASLGGGVWSAGAASLGALTLVSPAGQDGTRFTIGVTAGSSEAGAGATAFAATSLAVTVSAVAEAPLLSAAAATTAENGGAALTVALALSDTAADGDDTLGAVTLSGVPSGWSLSGDAAASLGGGVWSAGAASLGALTLVSPAGQDGTRFTIGVTAGSSEAGAGATAFAATSLAVTVSAVAEAPLLSAAAATTAENGGAALTLGLALSDTAADGDDTLGAVTLSGVPSGWSLSGDAAASLGGGVWSAGAASLGALTLVSPAGQDGTRFTIGVTAGSSEAGAGATAFAATSLAVTVSAVAEAPLLSAAAATTAENGGAALTVALALSDTAADGDDTLGAVTLSGVPSGWSLSGDAAASLGGGVWSAGAASLGALTLVSPAGQDGTRFTIGVTAGSSEAGAGATAFAATSLAVTVSAVAEAPLLSAAAATTAENGGAALTLGLALSDTAADGDDTLGAVTLSGVPSGWSLSGDAAASLGGGVWSAGAASLGALTLVSPAGQDGTRFTLGVTAGSGETGAAATAFAATSLAVTVSAVAEAPLLSAAAATTAENGGAALTLGLALSDTAADGDDTLGAVTLSGVPSGWSLSGDAAASLGGGVWSAGAASLGALTLVSPAGQDGTRFTLGVTAGSGEAGAAATAFAATSLAVTVSAVAEAPLLSAAAATTAENGGAALTLGLALSDTAADGDDTLGAVTLSGVPSGWSLSGDAAASLGGGVWSAAAASLGALTLVSPAGQDGTRFTLGVTAGSSETGAGATAFAATSLAVTVSAVAEAPLLSAAAATTAENGGAALTVALALSDTAADGDDTLGAVTLSGVPSGWSLSGDAAASLGGGVWSAGAASLGALTLVSPAGQDGTRFTIGVTAGSSEAGAGATAFAATSLAVTVSAVAEAPLLSAAAATTAENGGAALTVALALSDTAADGDDTLGAVTLSGVPSGWSLSGDAAASLGGGVWSAGAASLGALTLVSPAGQDGTRFTIGVTAGSSETGAGATAFAATSLAVTVSAVAEAPLLSAAAATTAENGGAALTLGLALSDTAADGDDTLGAVTLSGVPSGWSLSGDAAASLGGGVWSAAAASLGALTLVSPAGQDGTRFTLGVTAGSGETGAGATAFAATSLAVTVSAVAEAPTLTVSDATVGASTSTGVALTISLTIADTTFDGDDTLDSMTLGGVPSGWSLTGDGATSVALGTWTAGADSLSALRLVSPVGQNATAFTMTATAPAHEAGLTASTTAALTVSVITANGPLLIAVPGAQKLGVSFAGAITGISISETGSTSGETFTVTLTDAIGALSASGTGVSGSGTTSLTITGPLSQVNSDLGTVADTDNTAGSDTITLSAADSFGQSAAQQTIAVTAAAVTTGADLSGADLSGANLTSFNLSHSDLTGADLSGATLTSIDLVGATLTNANFSGADLTGAKLNNAGAGGVNLSGADLSGANLTQVDLTGANLTDANLGGAHLLNTNFTSATLTGADLFGAFNLPNATFTAAILPLTLSLVTASVGIHEITGDVADGFTGSITITAFDVTKNTTLGSTAFAYFTVTASANQPESWSISSTAFAQGDTIDVTAQDNAVPTYTVSNTLTAVAPAGVAGYPIDLALTDPAGGGPIAVTIAGIPQGWSLNAGTDLGSGTWTVETSEPSALAIATAADFTGAVVLAVNESPVNAGGNVTEFVGDNVEAYAPGNPIFALSGKDTLTGSGANDLFVFARPIGNDWIYNFKPARNRIDLIGFSGISSFADLQSRMANDANGDAVLTLGAGETITIEGVAVASLDAANFVFNAEPTTKNPGNMTIGDGATLPLGGTIDNAGTIALNSSGEETELVVLSDGITLEGGGRLALSDSTANAIVGGGVAATLTNRDNTIVGAGRIGDAAVTLDNEGVIDATGVNPLIIDTGGNPVSNSGTIEATGSGGLVIGSALVNSGTMLADDGTLTVDGAATGAGIAMIAGTATLEFGAASAENTSFATGAAGTLKLDRSAAFTGAISGFAAGDAIDLTDLAFGSKTALSYSDNASGGGTLTVDNGMRVIDLALLGQYAAAGFHAHSDLGGGTLITYSSQTNSADATSLTNLSH